jgi:uncharacterized SAM-binding protein YcdF (DUF218 family)
MLQRQSSDRHRAARLILALAVLLLLGAGVWCVWVYLQIQRYASQDQARPANAIAVFGAAEYDGRPSPVYRARLEHALALYRARYAPLVITLGGDGGDEYSEGGVGREYLMAQGVPEGAIIAETHSRSTAESVHRLAVIARANSLQTLIVVSDPVHLFRIQAICQASGLTVYTSPRAHIPTLAPPSALDASLHEILGYSAWRLHLE